MGLEKGDVFLDDAGGEWIFLGYMDVNNDIAIGTTYRGKVFRGIASFEVSEIEKDENYVGGFMIGEGA